MITFTGGDEIIAALTRIASAMPNEAASALYQEAQIEAAESQRRTPVDTGALRASHQVQDPEVDGHDISVTISVGGTAAPYAVVVHENLDAHHPVGQAKFLESTLLESKNTLAQRIAARINVAGLV